MHSSSPERGRAKLMLKLPALRTQIQHLVGDTIVELFESYDLATSALDRYRKQKPTNLNIVAEYDEICDEIEEEVSWYCNAIKLLQTR